MKSALVHGVLLVVMLVYGYRTWTRDKTVEVNHGDVVLWDRAPDDLVSVELKTDRKDVKLERRGAGGASYWWGTDTTTEKKPKPKTPPAQGSDAGSAGSGSGSGSAAPEMIETQKVRQYPLGDAADKVLAALTAARAMRDLGPPTDEQKKEFKLVDAKTTLTIAFKDGAHTFLVGGSPFGGGDRYVLDQGSGRAYVVTKDMVSALEAGENSLHLADPRGFDATKADQVTIESGGKSKSVAKIQTDAEGRQVKTWGDPETKKADQTIANFIDNANNLRPTEYQPDAKVADLTPVVKLSYRDDKGRPLGTLELLKRDKPAEPPPGVTPDPATPPKTVTEYFVMSEKTRVPALVRKEAAERTEQDVPTVFGDHPLELPPKAPPGHGFHPGAGPLPPVPTAPQNSSPAPAPAPAPAPVPVPGHANVAPAPVHAPAAPAAGPAPSSPAPAPAH